MKYDCKDNKTRKHTQQNLAVVWQIASSNANGERHHLSAPNPTYRYTDDTHKQTQSVMRTKLKGIAQVGGP